MLARTDLTESLQNDTLFVDHIGNAARKAGVSGAVGFAQDMVGIAKEEIGEMKFLGKGFVGGYRVEADTKNLYILGSKLVIKVTEPVPFSRSTRGVGFGIKPQHDFFTA